MRQSWHVIHPDTGEAVEVKPCAETDARIAELRERCLEFERTVDVMREAAARTAVMFRKTQPSVIDLERLEDEEVVALRDARREVRDALQHMRKGCPAPDREVADA